ncbi:dynein heavy chain domain-containing protein 1 [Heterodontus francisci]|uniref:dynein heavy chain domain-containing protein 1 n=1 Tax=Heterodontus francisci TaxID=7792 RepID=UPI00355BD463
MTDLPELRRGDWLVSQPGTGEAAVEMLAKYSHLGKTKFYYLNVRPSQQFRPYDLIVVSKDKLDSEHYVFSTFGVLFVSPSLGSEVMTLGEWQREAMLWRALTYVPFFRNYLLRKTFTRWYRNMKRLWVLNRRKLLWNCLLPAIPHFGAALLQISRLIQELQQVHWLPVHVTESYTLEEFQHLHNRRIAEDCSLLQKFFNYCTEILQLVREDSYKMVQDCETQLQLIKANFLKETMHHQRVQQEVAERRLQEAKQVIQSLGRLRALVCHMTVQNLITMAQSEVSNFIQHVLQTTNPTQLALLKVKLVFDVTSAPEEIPMTQVADALPALEELLSTPLPEALADMDTEPFDKMKPLSCELSCCIPQPSVLLGKLDSKGLRVSGKQLKGDFDTLSSNLLRAEIMADRGLQKAQRTQQLLIEDAMKELILFRGRHIWLSATYRMLRTWGLGELDKLRGWSPLQYQDHILQLKKWLRRAKRINRLFVTKNKLLALDCSIIEEEMVPALMSMKLDILNLLRMECEQGMGELITDLTKAIKQLQEKPTGDVAFAAYLSKLEQYNRRTPDFQERMDYTFSLIQVVRLQFRQYSLYEDNEEEQVEYLWNTFLQECKEATEFTTIQRDGIINRLDHNFKLLTAEVQMINSIITSGPFVDPSQNGVAILQQIQELRAKFWSLAESLQEINQSRKAIKGESFNLSFLTMTETNINSRRELWNLFYTALLDIQQWKNVLFNKLDLKQVVLVVDKWLSMLDQLRGSLPADDQILLAVEQPQMCYPFCYLTPDSTCSNLSWEEMERLRWHTEDSLMTLSMIVSTSAHGNIQEDAEKLMEMIQHFGELLDLWKMFQDKWVFLHQVFYEMELNARKPDPNLMLKIKEVDGLYRRVIQALSTNPSVLSVILSQDTKKYQGMTLRMIFSSGIAAMEEIILQMYHLLESARQEFTRLYFLSNDDLLHLLTLQSDPRKLLPFVKKCFRSVQDLDYELNSSPGLELLLPRVRVLAIYGDLQEKVNLTPPLEPTFSTIPWLRSLELRIQQSLFRSLETCITERTALAREINSTIMMESAARSEAYKAAQFMKHISKLASSFPVQCILIAEEICWHSDMVKVLFKRSASKEWFKILYSTKIDRLVMSVRGYCKRSTWGPEDPRILSLLKCLVTMSINHRDIGDNLMASNIESEASFEWQKLIKYQFDLNWIFPKRESMKPSVSYFGLSVPGGDHSQFGLRCYVNVLGSNFHYDYEYVGTKHWFVQTPQTERMCLALVLALQNFNPCALVGSCGTGKATTLSHLAKALGYQLVILHCCKDMNLAFITRVLSGAIQSGAWLVLENTDAMAPGTLSILGQHLTTIQNSYRQLITKDNSNTSYKDQGIGPYRKVLGTSLPNVTGSEGLNTRHRYSWSSEDMRQFDPTALGSIMFAGNVIPARVNYSAFVTLRTFDSSATIPENLRIVLRPVSVIQPDVKVITEVKLFSVGFLKASHLSRKILLFFEVAKDSGSITDYCYLPMMDKVIDTAAKVLYQTLQPKNPEMGSNLGTGHSNRSGPLQAQAQHELKGDGGDSGIDGGAEKSDTVAQCLLGRHQQTDNPTSTSTANEATELPNIIWSFSGSDTVGNIFESILLVEEYSVLKALTITLFPTVSDPEKLHSLKNLLINLFPKSCVPPYELEHHPNLLSAIKQELLDTDHQVTQEIVDNILALYQALKISKGVIMFGPSGSGKTTSYRTLSRTMNQLARNELKDAADQLNGTGPTHRTVQVSVIFPNSLSIEELLGAMDHQTWKNGILSKWLSEAESWPQARALVKEFKSPQVKPYHCPEPLRWIVLDGELCLDWMGPISSLLAHGHRLTLSNGEQISLAESTSLILEIGDLSSAAPSAVTWCNLVHCQGSDMWKAVLAHMMEKIYNNYIVPREMVEVWTRLSQDLVPKTLAFLEQHCASALTHQADYVMVKQNKVAFGLQEVMSFRSILNALLDKHLSRDQKQEDAVGVNQTTPLSHHQRSRLDDSILPKDNMLARNILAVAYIWGFGGHLHSSSWPQFDQFARQALGGSDYNIHIPSHGLVYDYYINPATGYLESLYRDNEPEKKKGKKLAYILIPEVTSAPEEIPMNQYLKPSHLHQLFSHAFIYILTAATHQAITLQLASDVTIGFFFQNSGVLEELLSAPRRYILQAGGEVAQTLTIMVKLPCDNSSRPGLVIQGPGLVIQGPGLVIQRPGLVIQGPGLLIQRPGLVIQGPGLVIQSSRAGHTGPHLSIHLGSPNLGFANSALDKGKLVYPYRGRMSIPYLALHFYSSCLEKYVKLLELLLSSGYSTLLVGERLSGKTSFVQALKRLTSCSIMYRLPISPNTRPKHARCYMTERAFSSGQQERSLPIAVTPIAKANILLFLDDVHTAPFKPGSGCQPVIETFRHSLACHGSYDRNCQQFRYFHSTHVHYIVTCAPLQGRTGFISSRFTRLFIVLALPAMTSGMLTAIYIPSVLEWLETFPTYTLARHALLAKALVSATIELYQKVRDKLRPSPSRAHYLFSMADVGKVLHGLLLMHHSSITTQVKPRQNKLKQSRLETSFSIVNITKSIVDLWLHESMRTFTDRLLTAADKKTLVQILEGVAQINFCTRTIEATKNPEPLQRVAESSIMVSLLTQSNVVEHQQGNILVSLEGQSAYKQREISQGEDAEAEETSNLDPQTQLTKTLMLKESGSKASSPSPERPVTTQRGSAYSEGNSWFASASAGQTDNTTTESNTGPNINLYPKPPEGSEGSEQKSQRRFKGRSRSRKKSDTLKPLLPLHLLSTGEVLSDLIYSKGAVRPDNKQQMNSPRWNPYRVVTSDTLAQQLRQIVQKQNHKNKTNYEIIFFNESVRHFARIYRVLCTPRGHCALLALTHCTGRKTLVRLAAYLTMVMVFEISGQMSKAQMAEVIKQASYQAGVQGRNTVIMAHGALGKDTFHDLCDVMTEGKYPDLYSASELEELAKVFAASKSLPWNVKAEQALERFFLAVVQFLHVVLLLDAEDSKYPLGLWNGLPGHLAHILLHCCSVDIWEPWSHQTYVQIATSHLGIGNLSTLNRTNGHSIAQIWMLLPVITKVMALIHQSALSYAKQMTPTLPLITPRHYVDFIDMFWMISYNLEQSVGFQTERMGLGLSKIQEVYNTAEDYKKEIDLLKHKLELLAEKMKQLHDQYTKVKREFIDLLLKCREEEFRVTLLLRELEAARKKFEREFGTVKPIYAAALKTLQALSSSDLNEVRTYRAPPPPVVMVMNTLCLMFGKPDGWDNVKQLLGQPNFYQDLEFYDKENVPEDLFKTLGYIVKQPEFQPDAVREASKAVESFSLWIKAVYQYATIAREYSPAFINEYQSRIEEAQTKLGLLRKQAFNMKRRLVDLLREAGDDYLSDSDSVTDLSDAEVLRLVEQKEQDLLSKLKEEEEMYLAEIEEWQKDLKVAENLMHALSPHQFEWDEALKQSKDRKITISGDGLLTAAAIIYLGPFEEKMRQELLKKWKTACYTGEIHMEPEDARQELVKLLPVKTPLTSQEKITSDADHQRAPTFIPIRSDFLLLDILSSLGEQLKWNCDKLPVNATARVSVLLARILVKCCPLPWPLFIDPDNQCEMWIQILQEGAGPQLKREVLGVPGTGATHLNLRIEGAPCNQSTETTPLNENVHSDFPPYARPVCELNLFDVLSEQVSTVGQDALMLSENPFPEVEENNSSIMALESATGKTPGDILEGISPVEDEEIDWVPELITEEPPNNLWVHCITTDNLDHILLTAASNGIAVLVTHIERRPLTPLLNKLLRVQPRWGDLGLWDLTFGKQQIEVKQTFRLYLSTSIPLRIIGSELNPTFLKHVSVTDFTISQSGLQELFLKEVLYFEKERVKDLLLTQKMDIIYLQHQLHVTQEELMDKVIQTATSLLNDNSIQAAALESQKTKDQIRSNLNALTTSQKDSSEATEDPYVVISHIGSEMYWALVQISRLNPLYYFSKTTFMKLVREALSSRNLSVRPSGAGTSKDHFMGLMNYLISKIYNYFRWCFFVKHARLYRFLVAVGHMKLINMVTQVEWELFLRGTCDLRYDSSVENACIQRPPWVREDIWKSCTILELLPAFHNLRSSLVKQAGQWQEYFGISSTVIGAAPCSAFLHLTIFQKAILWKLFQPNKLSVIMNDVVSCDLGGTLIRDLQLTLTSLFNYSWQNVPVMFLMPGAGSVSLSTHPLYWIEQMAREHQMQNNVHIISFGSHDQTAKILHELRKAMSKGNWLVLNNCHLLEHWDIHLVNLLTQLVTAYKRYIPSQAAAPTVLSEHFLCESPEEDILTILTESGDKIHRDFRLWLICRNDASDFLPGILRRQVTKLVIETPSMLQNTLKRTYTQAKNKLGDTVRPERLIILTALHSILLHRQHYGSWAQAHSYHWTQADLFAALHTQVKLQTAWEDSETLLELLIGVAVYRSHLLDRGDEAALISIISHCLSSTQSFTTRGIRSLITSLTRTTGSPLMNLTHQEIEKRIDLMPNSIVSVTVGICNGFEKQLFERSSEFMSEILLKTQKLFIPCQLDSSREESLKALVSDCIGHLQELQDSMTTQPRDPGTEAVQVITEPLRGFLLQESHNFKLLIDHLLCDLSYTRDVLEGNRLRNAESDDIIESLENGYLPHAWRVLTQVTPPLPQWVQILKMRWQLLNNYVDSLETPISYNLAAFQRPRMLLVILLQQRAQCEHLDLNRYRIQAQVLSSSLPPTSPPVSGIYITGLQLHNALWDTRHGLLQNTLSIKPCSIPAVWLKAEDGEAASVHLLYPQYECPVYQGAENVDVDLKDSNIITHLPLESKIDPSVCAQRRVHMVSVL